MKTIKILTAMILIGGMFAFMGCEDEEPGKLQIESIVAEGTDLETEETVTKDLNAAQSPTDVPPWRRRNFLQTLDNTLRHIEERGRIREIRFVPNDFQV